MSCPYVRCAAYLFAVALAMVAGPSKAQLEFGIPKPLPAYLNGGLAGLPTISPDNLSMYFTSSLPGNVDGSLLDIWVTSRASVADPWQAPVNLGAPINSSTLEMGTSLTADGLELYFERTSDLGSHFDGDLWVSKRASVSDPWAIPVPLNSVNTPGRDAFPYISPDGLTLYFDSTRDPNYPIPGNLVNGYVATRATRNDEFGPATWFEVSFAPRFTSDGLTFHWSGNDVVSKYYGLDAQPLDNDLWYRTRASSSDPFGPPLFMPSPISGSGLDCCAEFSADGASLFFTSTRPGGPGFINIWEARVAESIMLDIKPWSSSNPINLKSNGVLPVAVLSTSMFDAKQIDISTLLFGDPLLIADGKSPVSPRKSNYEDINQDGLVDLTLKFNMQDLLQNGVISAATVQGYLAGNLLDGTVIAGRDMVTIVPGTKSTPIPEPSTLLMILIGLAALTPGRRR